MRKDFSNGCDRDCRYKKKCKRTKGYEYNKHHLYWPKYDYISRLEAQFRSHPDNIKFLCRKDHDQIHLLLPPPHKPSVEFMIDFLNSHERKG